MIDHAQGSLGTVYRNQYLASARFAVHQPDRDHLGLLQNIGSDATGIQFGNTGQAPSSNHDGIIFPLLCKLNDILGKSESALLGHPFDTTGGDASADHVALVFIQQRLRQSGIPV